MNMRVLLVLVLCAGAWAMDRTWVGDASGYGTWAESSFWSPAGVPTPSDNLHIGPNKVCVIPSYIIAQGQSLTVEGKLLVDGTVGLGMTIQEGGEAGIYATSFYSPVRLVGGRLTVSGPSVINSPIELYASSHLDLEVPCTFNGLISESPYIIQPSTALLTVTAKKKLPTDVVLPAGVLNHVQVPYGMHIRAGDWTVNRSQITDGCGRIFLSQLSDASTVVTLGALDAQLSDWGSTAIVFVGDQYANSATLTMSRNMAIGPITYDAVAGGTPGIDIPSGLRLRTTVVDPTAFAGRIQGGGELVKAGAGAWTIRGAFSHTGTTVVEAGTLSLIAGAGRITASSAIRIDSGATLAITGTTTNPDVFDHIGNATPIDLRGTLALTAAESGVSGLAEVLGMVTCTGDASLLLSAGTDQPCTLTLAGLIINDLLTVTRRHRGSIGLARCMITGPNKGPPDKAKVDGPDGAYRADQGLVAATRRTTANGAWTSPLTWFGRVVPMIDDDVTIAHAITLDVAGVDIATLTFLGSAGMLSGAHALAVDTVRSEGSDTGSIAVPLSSLPVKLGSGGVSLAASSTASGTLRIAAGTLALAATDTLPSATVQIDAGAALAASADTTCAGLTGTGGVDAGTRTLILAVGAGDLAFSGNLRAGSLVKTGAGRQRLGGAGTVPTAIVMGGSLALSGIGSLSGDVEVRSGARCEGDGTIGGTLTLRSGGTVAPGINTTTTHPVGGAIGSLQCNQLMLEGGAHVDADLGFLADRLRVVAGLTLDAIPATINVTGASGYASGTWPIVDLDVGGTLTGSAVPLRGASPGSNVVIELSGGDVLWRVDATPPVLTRITSSTADGTWNTGDPIAIDLTYSEPVTLNGSLTATLGISPVARTVTIASGHGTVLSGTFTAQAGDWSAAGGAFARLDVTALALSGTLVDDAGNAVIAPSALPAINDRLRSTKALFVDNAAPEVATNLVLPATARGQVLLATRLVASDLETSQAALIYTLDLLPSKGRIERFDGTSWQSVTTWTQGEIDSDIIRYSTDEISAGSDAFAVTVHDVHAARPKTSELTAVRVTIAGASAPVFDDPGMAIVLVPGLTVSGTIHATDPQGTAVTYQQIDPSSTTNGVFAIAAGGAWTYQHRTWTGLSDQVTVRATDAVGEYSDLTIPVVVSSADDAAPCFRTPAPVWAQQDAQFSYVPTVTPGNDLVFTLIERPAGFDAAGGLFGGPANGTITWPVLPAAADGYHRFGILAVDPHTRKAGFQRVILRVTATPPGGEG